MFNKKRYIILMTSILFLIFKKRKLDFSKVINILKCYYFYLIKNKKSGQLPIIITFEMWNECNEKCLFCRTETGDIFDLNPKGQGLPIAKGKIDINIYKDIVDQVSKHTTMIIPYINGEPLMYKYIYDAISYASKNRLATLIASNGVLLNEKNSMKLLNTGLDFLKVHISGFTNAIHNIEHRIGNVEIIKRNLIKFMEANKQGNYKCMVMLDYILYKHNEKEVNLARSFANDNHLIFNLRPGNPKGLEETEDSQVSGPPPIDLECDFLWKALSINWDGSILPCCEYVVWSGDSPYGKFQINNTSIEKMWNGPIVEKMRMSHINNGRREIDICSGCYRKGVAFKF